MLLSSLALGVGVTRKMHEERKKEEREKNETRRNSCLTGFTDPLSAKETQQQIEALHSQIFP